MKYSESKPNDINLSKKNKTTFSIEPAPYTFYCKGCAMHFFCVRPKNRNHLPIGARTYGLGLPDIMTALHAENKQGGGNERIHSAYRLSGQYYFKEPNSKRTGSENRVPNYRNTNDNIVNTTTQYSKLGIMHSLGYTW